MAGRLLTSLKKRVTTLALEPSDGGCFEVTVDGKLIYSKLETGSFPEEADLVSKVQALAS